MGIFRGPSTSPSSVKEVPAQLQTGNAELVKSYESLNRINPEKRISIGSHEKPNIEKTVADALESEYARTRSLSDLGWDSIPRSLSDLLVLRVDSRSTPDGMRGVADCSVSEIYPNDSASNCVIDKFSGNGRSRRGPHIHSLRTY